MAITEIKDTDKLIDSVSVLNSNFNYLNNNKANKSTTLSGYGITDTYTKTETDNRYFPKTGGTIGGWITLTGNARLKNEDTQNGIEIYGGTGYNNGAYITLNGKDRNGGQFDIHAHDGTNTKVLVGKADGTLTWGGYSVITSQGGAINGLTTFTSNIIKKSSAIDRITLPTSNQYFDMIRCIDKNDLYLSRIYESYYTNGAHYTDILTYKNGSDNVYSTFRTGWNGNGESHCMFEGKEVERVNASGTNYIRYESGLQICYGVVTTTVVAGSENTITLGANFKDGGYTVTMSKLGDSLKTVFVKSRTASNFKYISDAGSGYVFSYIAIGQWK